VVGKQCESGGKIEIGERQALSALFLHSRFYSGWLDSNPKYYRAIIYFGKNPKQIKIRKKRWHKATIIKNYRKSQSRSHRLFLFCGEKGIFHESADGHEAYALGYRGDVAAQRGHIVEVDIAYQA
jgi:hypothetical protein